MNKFLKLVILVIFSGCFFSYPVYAQTRLRDRIREKLANNDPQSEKNVRKSSTPTKITLAGREVAVWEGPTAHTTTSKIVLFSHGFLGCNTQSSRLMQAIADAEFTVFAPNHDDAMCQKKEDRHITRPKFARPDQWSEESYKDRRDDFVGIIKALHSDPTWAHRLDFSNISLVGHSLGGYTVLGLAGAWSSWKLPNVKAVLGFSPYSLPYIKQKIVGNISAPTMFQGGTADAGITPPIKAKGGLFDQARPPSYFVEFDKATHFAFTDTNRKNDTLIKEYSIKFLRRYAAGETDVVITGPVPGVSDFRSK